MAEPSRLKEQCKALKLGHVPGAYLEIPYCDRDQYLTELFRAELDAQKAHRITRLIKRAGFPSFKTLEAFDWEPVTLPRSITITELSDVAFLDRHENVLALGAVGNGKSHLGIALGIKACMQGKSVLWYTCIDLVNILLEHHRQDRLGRVMRDLKKADLVVIDELGFVPLKREGAELLFNVVAAAYERQSIIVTSNLQFGEWNSVLGDNRLTTAMIDRLVHHAHILAFDGPSWRLRQALSAADVSDHPSNSALAGWGS